MPIPPRPHPCPRLFLVLILVFILTLCPSTFMVLTSRPKASNGQWFPCPALPSLVLLGGSRAAAPIGYEVLQNGEIFRPTVRPYVRRSVRPYVPPLRAQEPARQALDPTSQASEPARQASEPASQASEDMRVDTGKEYTFFFKDQ